MSLFDRFSRRSREEEVRPVDPNEENILEEEPPDIPVSEDEDLSDSSDEEEFSPYADDESDGTEDDVLPPSDEAARKHEFAIAQRQWLEDEGAHPKQAQEIFTAVGATWLRESIRVAQATVGYCGNHEGAVFAAGAFLAGLWGLLDVPETSHFDCRAASAALRALGVEPPRDQHNKLPRSREVYAKVMAGAYKSIKCGFVGSDELVQELTQSDPYEVGYVVGPESEQEPEEE